MPEYIRNHDRYLDPPDFISWATCKICGTTRDLGDMVEVDNDEWICDEWVSDDCLIEYLEQHPEVEE